MLIHSVEQQNTSQLSSVLPSDRGLPTMWDKGIQVSYHLYYHLTDAYPQCGTTEHRSVIICTTI